jgi:PAS domain S-box-containing protein
MPISTLSIDTILESVTDGFVFYDADERIRYWNRKAEELIGVPRAQAVGRNLWDCFPEEIGKGFYCRYRQAMVDQLTVHFEEHFERNDLWLEVTAYPSTEGLSIYFRDVTARKKEQQELQEIRQRFEYVLKATKDAISDFDLITNKGFWYGENFRKLFGYDYADAQAEPGSWVNNVHPDDVDYIRERFESTLRSGEDFFTSIYRFRKADGTYATVRDRSSIIRDSYGTPVRVIGTMEDITEQRTAQQALAENERKYRTLFNNAPLPQWIHDVETLRLLDVNEAMIWQYGYSRSELLSRTLLDLRSDGSRAAYEQALKEARNGEKTYLTSTHRRKDGSEFTIEVKSSIVDYNGVVARLATVNDITERESAKEALLRSEENYRRLFNNSPVAQYIAERDSLRINKVNAAAIQLYGYSREEFLSMTSFDLRPPDGRQTLQAAVEILKEKGQSQKILATHRKKDGEEILVELNGVLIDYEEVPSILVTITDITQEIEYEKKISELRVDTQKRVTRAQIQAQEKEREEIGRELHDNINQQLTTVKLYMDLAQARDDLRLPLVEKSEMLLAKTINEIRFLSKSLIAPIGEDAGFQQAVEELIASVGETQRFAISLACDPAVDAMPSDLLTCLYRVVQEQLTNISKYADASEARINIAMASTGIRLSIVDNGKGFDPHKRRSGVGITNIRNRVGIYNGTVTIESSPGKGCSVDVQIPLAVPVGLAGRAVDVLIAEENGDDKELLRDAFRKVAPGSRLLFIASGRELLDYLNGLPVKRLPGLIVMGCLMTLPGGTDTLETLHWDERYHHIPKIIYAASPAKQYREKSLQDIAAASIEKAFTLDEVVENVRLMLSFALQEG